MGDSKPQPDVSEEEAREVAEQSRQKTEGQSFLRNVFLGDFDLDLIHPYPDPSTERPEYVEFYSKLEHFLKEEVDSRKIDEEGEYPDHVVQELLDMGAFGMKIPEEYGGLGFSQPEYSKALELLGRHDSNLVAMLSAHQSIGVPQPLKLFGTKEQKEKYLPKCANEWISAFALTEPRVGSDPARLTTSYERTDDGDFVIDGEKLWCTNGTCGEVFVVMCKNHDTEDISAFVVEADWEGVEVDHRCRFMGLRALENGVISFNDVRVPEENLIGDEGAGLKIALVTLNTGRLSLPAAAVGGAKEALKICREWCNERVQWGQPIGKHEAVAHMVGDIAARGWAMESISDLSAQLATRDDYDIRLAASAAKEYNSTRGWDIIDDTLQVRGGRGYETERSLEERGEEPVPVERMMRDARINRIFEGSSEIMHLFMAREAVDKHLEVAGALVEGGDVGEIIKALPTIFFFYAWWFTKQVVRFTPWPKYSEFGELGKHLRFAERASRRLARNIFYGMMVYQAKLEKKQAFMARVVDIGMEIFVIAATVSRTQFLRDQNADSAETAARLTDLYCEEATLRIRQLFRDLWKNNDDLKYDVARDILEGELEWFEEHTVDADPDVAREYAEELAAKSESFSPDQAAE